MNSETILILILAIFVVILAMLLIKRIQRDRVRLSSLRTTNIAEFRRILSQTTLESDLQTVINDTTNLLSSSFGCDRLYFYRREYGVLRVSLTRGCEHPGDEDVRIPDVERLEEVLRAHHAPVPLADPALVAVLSPELFDHLNKQNCRLLIPLWWCEKLSGLFFVGNSSGGNDSGLALLLTGLARALGTDIVSKSKETTPLSPPPAGEKPKSNNVSPGVPPRLIELIELREPYTLVEKMLDTVKDHLQFDRFAYLYETGNESSPLRVIQDESGVTLSPPDLDEFRLLAKYIDGFDKESPVSMHFLADIPPESVAEGEKSAHDCHWTAELRRAGYEYLISFPHSCDRAGILAWNGPQMAVEMTNSLRSMNETGAVLMRNAESFQRIEELSYTDNLTGVANRRFFLRRLREEIERAGRYKRSLGLLMFDLDELKQINDSYGHLAGDYVIKSMGETLSSSVRAIDVIARYGGDEFCVIMPEADAATCRRSMTRLLRNISNSRFETGLGGKVISTTVSAGGALYPEHAEDSEGLIYAADMALLRAKESGRNCSLLYQAV